jgi:cyclic-di-GMP phosphodiesterase TipF (flagellum assembly factor)
MVLIAGSAGVAAFFGLGFTPIESVAVALMSMTALGLYNVVSNRVRSTDVVGTQLRDLSRSNAESAHQMGELGRRMTALEARLDAAQTRVRTTADPLAAEVGELGALLKQLADTVAAHDVRFGEIAKALSTPQVSPIVPAHDSATEAAAPAAIPAPLAADDGDSIPAADADADRLAVIRDGIDANRIDLYLQPIVTLPQRKVRFYEAMSRLRTGSGEIMPATDFVPLAERAGLMAKIDNVMVFRCVQVVRRLLLKNREIGLFCNVSLSTLTNATVFQQLLDFLDANRAVAPSVVLEFTQSALRAAGPIESESLSALAERGFRFSLDNLQDLRLEPRELASRGFRFVKVAGSLLLKPSDVASDIHPADLSDLLGRFGIDLIAEKIESEGTVVDLLDCDVRFGQGFLFSPPRPVRAEAIQGIAERGDVTARDTSPGDNPQALTAASDPREEPARPAGNGQPRTGLAQLARGISRV